MKYLCPSVDDQLKSITANFSHIRELYNLELGKHIKMAFKLTDKVLRPSSLEKTNVKLADSCFHESTINALAYYSSHGYAKFKETAEVLQIIRDWFNTVNVKYAWAMHCHIRDDDVCKNILMSSSNPRHVFCATFVEKLHDENETNAILTSSCVNLFEDISHRIASAVFNSIAKNIASEKNSKIHQHSKRKKEDPKKSSSARKQRTLTSTC